MQHSLIVWEIFQYDFLSSGIKLSIWLAQFSTAEDCVLIPWNYCERFL